MDCFDNDSLTRHEIAWQLAELFDELNIDQLNEIMEKNVPGEMLEFFSAYTDEFSAERSVADSARSGLPNLMILGYLLRVLEERLLQTPEPTHFDA